MEVVDGTFLTRKDDLNRMPELLLIFEQHLTAASARRDRLFKRLFRVDSCDNNLVEWHFGVHGGSRKSRRAFSAKPARIDGILLIGARDYFAIVHLDCCPDLEMGILRIRTGGCFLSMSQQFLQIVRQLLTIVIHPHLSF